MDPVTFQVDVSQFSKELSQNEQNQAAEKELQRAEKTLNRMISIINDKYRNNTTLMENILKSQDAWKEYREFHMLSVFPGPEFGWGSMFRMSYNIEKSRVTWLRVKELYKWVSPGKAGEEYPDPWHGSYGMYEKIVPEE